MKGSFPKRFFGFFLVLLSLGAVVYLWQTKPQHFRATVEGLKFPLFVQAPCSEPFEYSLGSFDTRFGLSEDEFLVAITEAGKLWEEESGRDLFVHNPEATFKINLIFDARQEETLRLQALDQTLSTVEEKQESFDQKQTTLTALYNQTKASYERDLAFFKDELDDYNDEVEKWNKRGGAPEDEYKDLQKKEKDLKSLRKELEKKRERLNTLANELNTSYKQETKMIEGYNADVTEYKNEFGEPEEFEEGLYTGTAIDIYQFEDRSQLIRVLAHELGHALGMEHVGNTQSIMYHFMEAESRTSLALTDEDRHAFQVVCNLAH